MKAKDRREMRQRKRGKKKSLGKRKDISN